MSFVRVAVVGCGGMGTIHARNLTALGLGEVVTFADAAPERAAALQADVGTGAVCTDVRRAIEDPRIQAVIIATHHDSHPDYAVMAANAGKHILIEKPLALTVAESRRIVEAVAANDVQLMVGFQARFAPLVTRAKAFIPQSLVSTGQMIDPRWSETRGRSRRTGAAPTSSPKACIRSTCSPTSTPRSRSPSLPVAGRSPTRIPRSLIAPSARSITRTAARHPP